MDRGLDGSWSEVSLDVFMDSPPPLLFVLHRAAEATRPREGCEGATPGGSVVGMPGVRSGIAERDSGRPHAGGVHRLRFDSRSLQAHAAPPAPLTRRGEAVTGGAFGRFFARERNCRTFWRRMRGVS